MLLYRYIDRLGNGGRYIYLDAIPVERETPRCYIVKVDMVTDKFIRKDPRGKRYAYANLEDAKNSYVIRKTRQQERLAKELEDVRKLLTVELKDYPVAPHTTVSPKGVNDGFIRMEW